MSHPTDLYENLGIDEWQIRVLTVHPGVGDEPLVTELQVADVLEYPGVKIVGQAKPITYRAISYCWGPSERVTHIVCNGQVMKVPQNTLQVLQRLRDEREPQNFWIDFVCINQDNHWERGLQIPRIAKIYHKAEEVLIWLGEGDLEIQCVLDNLQNPPFDPDTRVDAKKLETEMAFEWAHDTQPLQKVEVSCMLNGMTKLLELPWFQRTWTKQEVWAAKKPILHYGTVTCEWSNFSREGFEANLRGAVEQLQPRINDVRQHLMKCLVQHPRSDPLGFLSAQQHAKQNWLLEDDKPEFGHDLINVVRHTVGSQCTDPKDHVYGVLSMSTCVGLRPGEDDDRKGVLRIDYSPGIDAADVFEQLARYCIVRDQSLSILFLENAYDEPDRGRDLSYGDQPLQSWIPDWRRPFGTLRWLVEQMTEPISKIKPTFPAAFGPSYNNFHKCPLQIRGIHIGEVRTKPGHPSNQKSPLGDSFITTCMSKRLHFRKWNEKPLLEGLWKQETYLQTLWEMLWQVPRRAEQGDLVVVAMGAYAPILLRPRPARNIGWVYHEYIGPAFVRDFELLSFGSKSRYGAHVNSALSYRFEMVAEEDLETFQIT